MEANGGVGSSGLDHLQQSFRVIGIPLLISPTLQASNRGAAMSIFPDSRQCTRRLSAQVSSEVQVFTLSITPVVSCTILSPRHHNRCPTSC